MLRLSRRLFSTLKVPIEAIKKLREQTSSPIGECKKALEESGNNHEAALQWLRNKGMATAEKKADKSTREGVIAARTNPERTAATIVEVNCETDFVAKNELFLKFIDSLLNKSIRGPALAYDNVTNEEHTQAEIDKILKQEKPLGIFTDSKLENIFDEKKLLISKLQENIRIRRILTLSTQGMFGCYVHRNYTEGIGLQACLVEMLFNQPPQDKQSAAEFCDNIAAQYLGSPPKYLTENEIPADVLATETDKIKKDMAKALQKAPPHAHERMIKGKLNAALYSPYVFQHMHFILSTEGETTVNQYWKQSEEELEVTAEIGKIVSWKCK